MPDFHQSHRGRIHHAPARQRSSLTGKEIKIPYEFTMLRRRNGAGLRDYEAALALYCATKQKTERTDTQSKGRLFFSEEKNQKTFTSAPAYRSRPWPERWVLRRIKSLLVLFFRKERN
jgi:hypothetical protein